MPACSVAMKRCCSNSTCALQSLCHCHRCRHCHHHFITRSASIINHSHHHHHNDNHLHFWNGNMGMMREVGLAPREEKMMERGICSIKTINTTPHNSIQKLESPIPPPLRHKKCGWRYLGNEKSYQRSAGGDDDDH